MDWLIEEYADAFKDNKDYKNRQEELIENARFIQMIENPEIKTKLVELGAKEGDQVRILDFYFDFKN